MKRRGLTALLALTLLGHAGCLGGGHEDEGCYTESTRPLEPGEQVYGKDPVALLAPIAGHWRGVLTWRTGEVTDIDIDVPNGQTTAYTAYLFCDRVGQVFTHRQATVTTGDGALNDTTMMLARIRIGMDSFEYDLPVLYPMRGAFGPPAADIVDASRYTGASLTIELRWLDVTVPMSGRVIFNGTPAGADHVDRIELGTIAFDRVGA